MNHLEYAYKVEMKVSFTRAEAFALIELAKQHYDATCVAAGMRGGETHDRFGEFRENGFLAQLIMFSKPLDKAIEIVWPFRNFDITLKILEQRSMLRDLPQWRVLDDLNRDMNLACGLINAKYELLTNNYAEVEL